MKTEWSFREYLEQHNEPDPLCDGHLEDCERILYLDRRATPPTSPQSSSSSPPSISDED